MLDETEEEAPAAEADDTAADAGGDEAVDLADLGGGVETADEPAVTAEELMDIPDAPEVPGREDLTEARAAEATAQGEQAATEDAAAGGAEPVEDDS